MDEPPPIPPRPPGFELQSPPPPQQQQEQYQQQYQQQQQQQQQYYSRPPHQQPLAQQWQPQYAAHQQQSMSPPQQSHPPPSGWNEHLFYSNGKPTPAFEAMMKEFFMRLDPQFTGYITPDAFSSFLAACNYKPEDDIWKRHHKSGYMYAPEDMADAEFLWTIEGFRFDHKKVVRNPENKQMPYGGMPLLSLAGFTDFMSVDFASDADEHLDGINAALRYYRVWPERGPLPRSVLPPSCPPELQRRVDEAIERCRQGNQDKINAQLANARMQGMAGRAAVALTSNYTYSYY